MGKQEGTKQYNGRCFRNKPEGECLCVLRGAGVESKAGRHRIKGLACRRISVPLLTLLCFLAGFAPVSHQFYNQNGPLLTPGGRGGEGKPEGAGGSFSARVAVSSARRAPAQVTCTALAGTTGLPPPTPPPNLCPRSVPHLTSVPHFSTSAHTLACGHRSAAPLQEASSNPSARVTPRPPGSHASLHICAPGVSISAVSALRATSAVDTSGLSDGHTVGTWQTFSTPITPLQANRTAGPGLM